MAVAVIKLINEMSGWFKRVDSVSLGVEAVFTYLTVVDYYDELKTKYSRIIFMLSKSLVLGHLGFTKEGFQRLEKQRRNMYCYVKGQSNKILKFFLHRHTIANKINLPICYHENIWHMIIIEIYEFLSELIISSRNCEGWRPTRKTTLLSDMGLSS